MVDDTVATQVKKVVEATDDVREALSSMAENACTTIEKDTDGVSKALGDTMGDVAAKVQDAMEDDLEQISKAAEGVQLDIRDGEKGMENVGEALINVTKSVEKVPEDVVSSRRMPWGWVIGWMRLWLLMPWLLTYRIWSRGI